MYISTYDRVRKLQVAYKIPSSPGTFGLTEALDRLDEAAGYNTTGGRTRFNDFNGRRELPVNQVGKRLRMHEEYLKGKEEDYFFWLGALAVAD